ncbi:MAG TPA: nitroreductase family deazaflavin-dependent oxidoreductase [Candidatus Binataceae bacterium]|nr:nitroreductase family deazaflavin-dependent oxidoreductase [Candidatus Binataceae bacterium]
MATSPDEAYVNHLITDSRAMDELNQGVIKEFRANQGIVSGAMEGMPILLLTMTGAKSGRTLTRPLCYSRDGGRVIIIASYGGAPGNPPWYHNLLANPLVTVELGTEKFKARAAEAHGAERQRLFDGQARLMPFFNDYQKKTKRQIPVITLTRID